MKWALPFLAAAVAAALCLCRVDGGRLPQMAKGGDALSVAFADAKEAISAAMVQKADSYFHGGVDIDCHERHDHEHEHESECGHGRHHDGDDEREAPAFDPWRWINLHVRAPEKHIHLDGEKAVELLPWFWAAVRADPHNIDAWTTAAYAADRMMKDKALARRVIREAREKNPDSLELAWTEARMVYDGGKGDVDEAERLFESAKAIGQRLCDGRLPELSENDARIYGYVLEYLSKIREKRGEEKQVTTTRNNQHEELSREKRH